MGSRRKMIESTLQLLRRQGLRATGISRIIKASGSPRGSIYFHFPGGKEQLTIEALRVAGETVAERIRSALDAQKSASGALKKLVAWYAAEMRRTGYQRGCPVANVASDAAADAPAIRAVCAEIFDRWLNLIALGLERDGFRRKDAVAMAEFILSSIEGALILCRTQRSVVPMQRVGQHLLTMLGRRSNAPGCDGRAPRPSQTPR